MGEFQLQEMIQICADKSHPQFNKAWTYFQKKYKKYIYKIVNNQYILNQHTFPSGEASEIVNDIVGDVFHLLSRNNGRALAQFNAIHSESAFRGYLATISNRVAKRTLQRIHFHTSLDEAYHIKESNVPQQSRWQIFDYIVAILRQRAGRQERNIERNILLFNLYTFEEYNKNMLKKIPIFLKIGHRVVDNVVMRSRAKLNKNDENLLRELLKE